MRQPLSGLVAKGGYNGHKHNWQRMERRAGDALFFLFVCTEHPEPVIQAYDVRKATTPLLADTAARDQEVIERKAKLRNRK